MNSINLAVVIYCVRSGIVDFPHLTFSEYFFFTTDGELDLVVGDNRDVDTMTFQQAEQAIGMGIDSTVSRQTRKECPHDIAVVAEIIIDIIKNRF